jgi:hypothetical protein
MTTRTVIIPACYEHAGMLSWTVELEWTCPVCGGPRGEPSDGFSYDGSRRLAVSTWKNPCGHPDRYEDIRRRLLEEATPPAA